MEKKIYTEAHIEAIANAIRATNKKTDKYKVSQMAAAIKGLSSGLKAVDVNIEIAEYTTSSL